MSPCVIHIIHRVLIDIRNFAATDLHRVRARPCRHNYILTAVRDGGHRVVQCLTHTMHVLGIVRWRVELAGSQIIGKRPYRIVTRTVRIGVMELHCTCAIRVDVRNTVRKRDRNRIAAYIYYLSWRRTMHIRYARHILGPIIRNRSNGLRKCYMIGVCPVVFQTFTISIDIGECNGTFAVRPVIRPDCIGSRNRCIQNISTNIFHHRQHSPCRRNNRRNAFHICTHSHQTLL